MNHERTADYLAAHAAATAGLKAGEFRAICVGHDGNRGRYIEVETDQGWNPHAFWQEDDESEDPARYL